MRDTFDALSPEQAATFIGVKSCTLARWRFLGTGPQFTVIGGRLIRYERADILAWLESRKRTRTFRACEQAVAA